MDNKDKYNGITYEVCLYAVKRGFAAIGGVQNAIHLTGFEWHRKVAKHKAKSKKVA